MSNNAVLSALRRMDISGDEMTGHGFRATARTIGAEVLGFRPDLLEHQLAHTVKIRWDVRTIEPPSCRSGVK